MSLPMRERELKRCVINRCNQRLKVAPHAGARIETTIECRQKEMTAVAPHAGARIETVDIAVDEDLANVAPHAGARIETTWYIDR